MSPLSILDLQEIQRITRLKLTDNSGKTYYLLFLGLANSVIYGELLPTPLSRPIGGWNICKELTTDDLIVRHADSDSDFPQWEIIHTDRLETWMLIEPHYKDLPKLVENNTMLWCDYMDQGIDDCYIKCHSDDPAPVRKAEIERLIAEDTIWDDGGLIGFCSGERILVTLDEYNDDFHVDTKVSDWINGYGLYPIEQDTSDL